MAGHRGLPRRARHQPPRGDGVLSLSVRTARADDDFDLLGAIVVAAYRALPGYEDDEGYYAYVADMRHHDRVAEVLVAELDGRPVGCVVFVAEHDNEMAETDDPGAACFRMLGVDPSAQGTGVGRALVEACLARAGSLGKRRVAIHSHVAMTRAHALYASLGFEHRPELDWEPVPGVELYGFTKELP